MEYLPTDLPEVLLIKPKVFGDQRGFFMETFRQSEFEEICGRVDFVQDNHSGSPQGILRGLHYQLKNTQGKLVRVVYGEVFDVAVDIRQGSPTFGKWTGQILSAENKHQLWVPGGFAHGYYVISEWAEFVYKTTDYYAPAWERSLLWNDLAIGIEWPLVNGEAPTLSAKDAAAPLLKDADVFPLGWTKDQKENR
ncbi:MAG: dTDP-4-dehydrorhamnose 3,5-epimerase [Anaerolineaceae bacterium]|nr:dTDP-4-dehydrorhamnose 3,5-epimerase [Anaerolineaceae bacterium]MDD4043231.1 dTDP-4-dehydrorhamnose 3,5-epimerase [Anaerolineaceae bacterium]MDD4578399.1 dTDP-4-dehydrorhamnose 3,5-epimerase [Anaerolineaceae bacterium]